MSHTSVVSYLKTQAVNETARAIFTESGTDAICRASWDDQHPDSPILPTDLIDAVQRLSDDYFAHRE